MNDDPRVQELITLKTIAETLNQSNDLRLMLNIVLVKLLELTGLSAGWIFLVDDEMSYECVADHDLPHGLLYRDKQPMRCETCWCLDRYRSCKLQNAVNILTCKRLMNVKEYGWGDTAGFTHHATVPLYSGSRRFGVMNVASPGKVHFSGEELALLEAVAYQLGSAVERMRLYEAEQSRADQYARLGEFSRELGTAGSMEHSAAALPELAVSLIGSHFHWAFAALFERDGFEFVLKAVSVEGQLANRAARHLLPEDHWLFEAARGDRYVTATPEQAADLADHLELHGLQKKLSSAMAAPVRVVGADIQGILVVGHSASASHADGGVLGALAEHIAIVLESARMEENRREWTRLEERNRLARDLHDSVSQMLFSLSMTAKGVEGQLRGSHTEEALESVKDIQLLSQNAQREMRALIMQLRPTGLEAGLTSALLAYGKGLKLRVRTRATGSRELPRNVEEALWRIGQEALNNVFKHAGTSEACLVVQLDEDKAVLRISDAGRGIAKKQLIQTNRRSLGLTTMKERAEALGGSLAITSGYRKGTSIEVAIPIPMPVPAASAITGGD
ncbi:GAF domain-containing sensor histidine kinase [Paenibacillus nasutitermitis]|uniref:histidine kinase n=1 Tax=Paenibacillus nasutitermitis TaxID=1652958 RepID=A0A916Z5L6_9BACL|nr:GAF domain-containing sensor histidine kinase [Paenibacillus nasutitermitis]GGD77477.1 histidine kinase [Paenibacillus nasutitermitis]